MGVPSIPINFFVTQANRQVLAQWSLVAGAISYTVQRSTDQINYSTIATVTGATSYLDSSVTVGTSYWYQVAAVALQPQFGTGSITFTGQPSNGDTFSVANVTYTAVTSGASGNQFNIGLTTAITIANIVKVLNASGSSVANIVVASGSATVLTLTAYSYGPEGNGIQLSSSLTNTTFATFAGGTNGNSSAFTTPQQIIPAPTGEFSLAGIRLAAQQRADRVNSQFITTQEWNSYINQAMFELYDLLITTYTDLYVATPAQFITNNTQPFYPLPDGSTAFQNGITGAPNFIAPPFYKLLGVDLGLNTANNAWVTVKKFNFIDRNRFIYPNTASTIYGVFNLQYRVLDDQIEFIPTPSSNQPIRLWYIPRMTELLQDTDITTTGISGWIEYVIVRAAKYALDKEESDTTKLDAQLLYLKGRIEESAQNRDVGVPDTISDIRGTSWNGQSGNGWGPQGSNGGW